MTERITRKHLDRMVSRINDLAGSPTEPYIDGKAQIGNHHLSGAYGGWCLHRMCNESGGIRTPIISYHTNTRHLYELMCAYADGFADAKGE